MRSLRGVGLGLLLIGLASGLRADEGTWLELIGSKGLDAWRSPTGAWYEASRAQIDPHDPKKLIGQPGEGVWINGPTGKTRNLLTKETFGDVEVHLEFLIPKGSNSGIKLQGLYEIQIYDSVGAKTLSGSHCGGIYPRAELLPRYHHTDDGHPPQVDAAKAPGEWQTLDILFRAPRFDAQGKKIANARFVKVLLNGKLVQDDVEISAPTGHYWRLPEVAQGPILIQADHGPVAFRNVRVRRTD
jgi:hypothetical protein